MNVFILRKYPATLLKLAGIAVILLLCAGVLIRSFLEKNTAAISCKDCNVLVIAIDPLRADSLRSMGGTRDNAPNIDALSAQGYAFTNTIAASSWTLPSAMSFMTGTYPASHGIINKELFGTTKEDGLRPARLRDSAPNLTPLVSLFKDHGYATGSFAGGAALDADYGFSAGFDAYESAGDFEDIASSSAKALDFVRKHKEGKMFVFLHGFDVHGQYEPPEGLDYRYVSPSYTGDLTGGTVEQKELREQGVLQGSIYITPEDAAFLRAIYDEKVSRLDERVGKFLKSYYASGVKRDTIMVFTSHHGDEFYEHGRIDHGMTLYDEVIRVPLIIALPGAAKKVQVSQQVRNVDILPTLLDLVGIPTPKEVSIRLDGVSLVPAMKGEELTLDAFSETAYRYATFQTAVRGWDGWKLLYDHEQQVKRLYNLTNDVDELNDRYGQDDPPQQRLINLLLTFINKKREK